MKYSCREQKDEYSHEISTKIDQLIEDADFYKDEYQKTSNEIDRLFKLRLSYLRSFISNIIKRNELISYVNDDKISSIHDEEGFMKTKFYVEQLRRLFFKDDECESLRKFNCIDICRTASCVTDEAKLEYKFYDGNNIFSIMIPYRDNVEHILSKINKDDHLMWLSPFSYGTIDIVLHYSKNCNDDYYDDKNCNDDYYDDVKVFSSHSISEIREKLVEFAIDEFTAEKKKIDAELNH